MDAIVSVTRNWAIGRAGGLLVRNKADMHRFVELTRGYTCIMGRKTYESFPGGPLKGRRNVIVTRQEGYQPPKAEGLLETDLVKGQEQASSLRPTSVLIVSSPEEALAATASDAQVWLIGGESLYRALLPSCSSVYVTKNDVDVPDADAFFPNLDQDPSWLLAEDEGSGITAAGISYDFLRYTKQGCR